MEVNSRPSILIVDDEANILKSLQRLFMDEEFDVITAGSGIEGLGVVKGNRNIAVIISDQRMPGMTGAEFLEKTREFLPNTARFVLTGYADVNAAVDAINKGGAQKYITKPWQDEELCQIVRDSVSRYLLVAENRRLADLVKQQNEKLQKWNTDLENMVQQQTMKIQNQNNSLELLNKKLRHEFEELIVALGGLIELRDQGASRHFKNVADISGYTAKLLKLPGKDIEHIIVAALLHDIGKIGMPDILFIKNFEDMNTEEQREYMMHPIRGQYALESIDSLKPASLIIKHHHEFFNGLGFPDKLSGDKIPIGSRIIGMADRIDHIIRIIKGGDAIRLSLREIRKDTGSLFDPMIYDAFEEAVQEIYKKILARIVAIEEIEVELYPDDLQPGMIVSRTYNTDKFILNKGTILNNYNINILKLSYNANPSNGGIFIRIKK